MAPRLGLAAVLSLAVALPACVSDDETDPATESQVRARIASLATLRGMDLANDIEILGVYMRPHSIPYLMDALQSDDSPRVRAGCASALGRSQDGRAVEALAGAAAGDSNPGVRFEAAYNLCLFRDGRGVPVLLDALRTDDVLWRRRAVDDLRRLTGLEFGYNPEDPPEKRNAAADRWDAWYREQGPDRVGAKLIPPSGG
jgi:HEAT repeat protein